MKTDIFIPIILHRWNEIDQIDRTEAKLLEIIDNTVKEDVQGIKIDVTESEKKNLFNHLKNEFSSDIISNSDIFIERGVTINARDIRKWDSETKNFWYYNFHSNFKRKPLSKKLGDDKANEIMKSIGDETMSIIESINHPRRGSNFDTKGLVLGYVQSGKTANYTGLIARAADIGYKFIIVLTGMHEILRYQTQKRIEQELIGPGSGSIINEHDLYIDYSNQAPNRMWKPLTYAGQHYDRNNSGEFQVPPQPFSIFCSSNIDSSPVIAVIKKNTQVMQKLLNWVSAHNKEQTEWSDVPALIIDDEADQASIDTNSSKENADRTKTNKLLVQTIRQFKQRAYVSYTATPFANVFVNKNDYDDIYPHSFIHSLPEPEGYFGSDKIFGDNANKYFVCPTADNRQEFVSKEEKSHLLEENTIPTKLEESIFIFILSSAIRSFRGANKEHMSMLIHMDHTILNMEEIHHRVNSYIKILKNTLNSNDSSSRIKIDKFNKFYEIIIKCSNQIQNLYNFNYKLPSSFNELRPYIDGIINELDVVQLHSQSEDNLNYEGNLPIKVIAIGGNKLSRGLTLEGLSTSYYLRDTRNYDTLLQMGRWFGYRTGYEDLIKIYCTETINDHYNHLSIVEEDLRDNILYHYSDGLTPKEFAPLVLDHYRMNTTASNNGGYIMLSSKIHIILVPMKIFPTPTYRFRW